jgi:hemin uptake protein HemP
MRLRSRRTGRRLPRAARARTHLRQRRRQVRTRLAAPHRPGPASEEAEESPSHALCVHSEDILQGDRELRIVHGEETYRLLVTRNNRLILQK